MGASSTSERVAVLRAALRLWDHLFHGRDGRAVAAEELALLGAAVGGHLLDDDGLRRADTLRALLRAWLRPGRQAAGFQQFLVSWGLSAHAEAVKQWQRDGAPRRIDPAPHLARAVGWDKDRPGVIDPGTYRYLSHGDLYPDRGAGELVDAGVRRLLNSGVPLLAPKHGRLAADMRQRLTPAHADRLGLFGSDRDGPDATPTTEVTRLAFTLMVAGSLERYVSLYNDPLSEADDALQALAADVLPYWSEPPERLALRRLSIDPTIPHRLTGAGEGPSPEFIDLQAMFRSFTERARDFHGSGRSAERPRPDDAGAVAFRRLAFLLELAINDVIEYRSDGAVRIDDRIAGLITEVLDAQQHQHDTHVMLDLQRRLHVPPRQRTRERTDGRSFTFLDRVLHRLADRNRLGDAVLPRADDAANVDEVETLVQHAQQFLTSGRGGPESILRRFAEDLPAAVTALTRGNGSALGLKSAADARWALLSASGRALALRPDTTESVTVAGSFAELGWVVANERAPADMRAVNDQVYRELSGIKAGPMQARLAVPLIRISRVRPLADSKKANFGVAQQAAHESVIFGSQALDSAMRDPEATVRQIVGALTGLQLSLLQAGGVFIRSAETELIFSIRYDNPAQRAGHADYIRGLIATSYTYTNLAVARLHDLRDVERSGLVSSADLNYPSTAAASTGMMGMRSLLLWANIHIAYRTELAKQVRTLIPSIPGQFCGMLKLKHLSRLNFADMTRIAMHHAFLSGDFTHPARGAKSWHPDTPEHLRPSAGSTLDLDACGRYLVANGFDTGILDVIQLGAVRQALDETSDGRFTEWRDGYFNPTKRSLVRFNRGDLAYASIRFRDATVGT
ncbi:hypothetical protein OHA72_04605 [Dactylosporangium sp. NBC_01737]|uniref:hypothetical protein n=1 Tax=Dactylosporangium sp. NBC_01737 TaxID=2975959 RepID=UPI002E0EEDC5|nr:hypothetical protein OHA72_04605 [Dactylosporangium sp. NBC_01737]